MIKFICTVKGCLFKSLSWVSASGKQGLQFEQPMCICGRNEDSYHYPFFVLNMQNREALRITQYFLGGHYISLIEMFMYEMITTCSKKLQKRVLFPLIKCSY